MGIIFYGVMSCYHTGRTFSFIEAKGKEGIEEHWERKKVIKLNGFSIKFNIFGHLQKLLLMILLIFGCVQDCNN